MSGADGPSTGHRRRRASSEAAGRPPSQTGSIQATTSNDGRDNSARASDWWSMTTSERRGTGEGYRSRELPDRHRPNFPEVAPPIRLSDASKKTGYLSSVFDCKCTALRAIVRLDPRPPRDITSRADRVRATPACTELWVPGQQRECFAEFQTFEEGAVEGEPVMPARGSR